LGLRGWGSTYWLLKMASGDGIRREKGFEAGNWFLSAGYWLFPVSLLDRVAVRSKELKALNKAMNLEVSNPDLEPVSTEIASRNEAEIRTAELKRLVEAQLTLFDREYNSQPVWHLRELAMGSGEDARRAVNEFLEMVETTSCEFVWPTNDPDEGCHWRVHGWKHVTYSNLKMFWEDHLSGFEPAINRVCALGSAEEIRELFLAASREDPEAVGIVWTQFPQAQDHKEIIDNYFNVNERVRRIPRPSELASDLVDSIFQHPGSKEADQARDKLLKLVSLSVRRGSRSRRGRPKIRIPPDSLRLLWKMSYCLVLQALELNEFLALHNQLERDRHKILLGAYPWISSAARNLDDFFSLGASRAALEIVGNMTQLSPSSLEKMGLRSGS
jgi:hypothetical protein